MNEIQKFKNEVEGVIADLDILITSLDTGSSVAPDYTVTRMVELYEDTADRLRKSFNTLKEEMGNRLIIELKDYGKECNPPCPVRLL